MMQLGETSITLKMLNFYNYQGKNSSYIYKKMINAPNFMNYLEEVIKYFDMSVID